MSIVPYYEYILVIPNGEVRGFESIEEGKAFVNLYYNKRVMSSNRVDQYNDITDTNDEIVNVVCHNLGVIEGECKLYNTTDIIEEIHEKVVFDEEKQDIISSLMVKDIKLNIYDLGIDDIFINVESIDILEPYGSPLTDK